MNINNELISVKGNIENAIILVRDICKGDPVSEIANTPLLLDIIKDYLLQSVRQIEDIDALLRHSERLFNNY